MLPSITPLPNFFIVGASGAGTTSLNDHLDQHPEIYMSPLREPSFFSLEVRPETFEPALQQYTRQQQAATRNYIRGPMNRSGVSGIVTEWEDYIRLFAGVRDQPAIGEVSVSYLWSPTAAKAIASVLPHTRILIILRDPADRAFCQYLHNVSGGLVTTSFRSHINASMLHNAAGFTALSPLLELGLYTEQVQRYLSLFPAEQIRIWLYEDTTSNPQRFLCEVLRFLGVDPALTEHPQTTGIAQTPHRNGLWTALKNLTPTPIKPFTKNKKTSSEKMSANDRRFLINYYKADIDRLAKLLDRDLSSWLR
jgi:hypothetical protein